MTRGFRFSTSANVDDSDRAVELDLGPQRGGPGLQVGKDAVGGRGIGEMRHAATSAIARVADIERIEAHRRRIAVVRSEEHTSELQSLMRISYAVFCLKKKKQRTNK